MSDQPGALCAIEDIPEDGCKGFTLGTRATIFAVRKDGEVYIYWNTCPHQSMELNWMPDRFLDRDKEFILCTAHGALFDIASGLCVAGPCAGSGLKPVAHAIEDRLIYLVNA